MPSRHFLAVWAAAALTLASALSGQDPPDRRPSGAKYRFANEDSITFAHHEAFIHALERALLGLRPLFAHSPSASALADYFELVRIDIDNPQRHYATFLTRWGNDSTHRLENPNYYFYEVLPSDAPVAAAFDPRMRVLGLSPDLDSLSPISLAVVLHEVVHIGQDNIVRQRLSSQTDRTEYRRFYLPLADGKMTSSLRSEALAYATEILLLDALTKGGLSANATRSDTVGMRRALETLASTAYERRVLPLLTELALLYYSPVQRPGLIPESFLEFVASEYARRGFVVYAPAGDGHLVPYYDSQRNAYPQFVDQGQ